MMELRSPLTGRSLSPDGPHALSDGQAERWPVIDGIAYLRAGSIALAQAALARLDAGDAEGALALLLAENDNWWDQPPPPEAELRRLIAARASLSLREVMARLGWGRVGDYFAHRWSDPTFIAGLALVDAHWTAPATAFELACGIGHHLAALTGAGVAVTGGDIVFGKLWVARHWVLSKPARLVCFDADRPWPITGSFDLACCHDAFYFLGDKPRAAAGLRALTGAGGSLAISHIHNLDCSTGPGFSPGTAMTTDDIQALFPDALTYDDQALTLAGAAGVTPWHYPLRELAAAEAISLIDGAGAAKPAFPASGTLSRPSPGTALIRNPLLTGDGGIAWPSPRYRDEYAARATYGRSTEPLPAAAVMNSATAAAAARRDLLALPARW